MTAALGAGGMGEVYRATDSKLGREVAVKLLPAALASDTDRLARFEREARVLASLNHPGIAHLYGFESATLPDGTEAHVLLMELVEGEDLAARLKRGAIPVDEAVAIARQVAEALEEAHEKGIVHRDLKPANVKVTPDGKVKVLDFGLAKAWSGEGPGATSSADLSQSPTLAATGTAAGIILGTAAYMSPEQARGKAVDKRADIWALGVLLFEMLTGRRLFEGETVSDTLAAVLRQDVDWTALPPSTPRRLRRLLERCLDRDPRRRLRDVGEARLAIDAILAAAPEPEAAAPDRDAGAFRRPLGWLAAALLLAVGATAGWLARPAGRSATAPGSRWALALPDGFTLSMVDSPQLALSRDGRVQAAVVDGPSGVSQILVRRSDEFEPKLLAGTEGAYSPLFSPDGSWIGFFLGGALMKMPVDGGPAIRLATGGVQSRGAVWSRDGWIYFARDYAEPLSRVRETGGEIEAVTRLDTARSERTHRWPDALPDGSALLFTSDTQASPEYYDDARIEAVRLATGERKVLVEGSSMARFAGDHLLFARAGSLYAARLDPRALELRGAPFEVASGVATNVGSGAVQVALDETGVALWSRGGLSASYRVVWVDRDGRERPVAMPPAPYHELALSPDGTRLALVGGPGGLADLWVADLGRGTATRLTFDEFVRVPVWTPDGSRIAYAVMTKSANDTRNRVEWRAADGGGDADVLIPEGPTKFPGGFTPDGRALLFDSDPSGRAAAREEAGFRSEIAELSLADRSIRVLTDGPYTKGAGVVSPDGRWLAYVANDGSRETVTVRPYPSGEGRWPVSTVRGVEPRWGPDGRALYFRSDAVLHRVAIDTSRGFSASRPERVLDRVATGASTHSYSITPDDGRIVTLRTAEGSGAQRILYLDLGFGRRLAGARGGPGGDPPGVDGGRATP